MAHLTLGKTAPALWLVVLATGCGSFFITKINKSKRSELPSCTKAIAMAQLSYNAEYDAFLAIELHPTTPPGKDNRDFPAGSGFDDLKWSPDAQVRGSYKVDVTTDGFKVTGISDVDGDGVQATYTVTGGLGKDLEDGWETADDVY